MRNSPRSTDNKRAKKSKANQSNGNITESAANTRIQPPPDSQSESEQQQEPKISNNNSKSKVFVEDEDKDDDLLLTTKFPMNRINRIVRSGGADDMRITQEAVFLINKASECFLDLFCEEAYAGAVQDHKNYIAYKNLAYSRTQKSIRIEDQIQMSPEVSKTLLPTTIPYPARTSGIRARHRLDSQTELRGSYQFPPSDLASIVSKQRRYDFLSDFIPEKIKAEDALEERKSAGA